MITKKTDPKPMNPGSVALTVLGLGFLDETAKNERHYAEGDKRQAEHQRQLDALEGRLIEWGNTTPQPEAVEQTRLRHQYGLWGMEELHGCPEDIEALMLPIYGKDWRKYHPRGHLL